MTPVVRRTLLVLFVSGAAALFAVHVSRVVQRLSFSYDLILWGDDYFMTSMAKLAAGVPLYGPIADANSTVYAPGGAWLHHLLLAPFHASTSLLANRLLTLAWLALALVVSTAAVTSVSRRLHGRLSSRLDETLLVLLTFLVLAVAALANPVIDSLHPTDLELFCLSLTTAALAAWTELSPAGRFAVALVLPAASGLAKQTAGLAVAAVFAAVFLRERERPLGVRVHRAFLPVAALGLALVLANLATDGGFFRWGFGVLGKHPFDWKKITDLSIVGYSVLFLPAFVVAVLSVATLRKGEDEGSLAIRRVALLPLAYTVPALAALFKRFGGPNNLAVLGFLLLTVALPTLLAPLRATADSPRAPSSAVVSTLLLAVLVGQTGLLYCRRRVPSAIAYQSAETICSYAAARMRCGERVHLGRGTVCYLRGGVPFPVDRINSIGEVSEAGMRGQLGFFSRVRAEHYDVLAIPMTDLLFLGEDFWSTFREHYVAFFQTQGEELENNFWYDGWQGYVSWPVVFFERNRDRGTHHVTPEGFRCE